MVRDRIRNPYVVTINRPRIKKNEEVSFRTKKLANAFIKQKKNFVEKGTKFKIKSFKGMY